MGGNIGSSNGPYSSDTWEYDPLNDSWALKFPVPGIPRYGMRSFATSTKGYVLGGVSYNGPTIQFSYCYEYNPAGGGSWTSKPNFLGQGRHYAATFMLKNHGVIGTGNSLPTSAPPLDDFQSYNPGANTWHPLPSLPTGNGRWGAVGFNIGDRCFVGTGSKSLTSVVAQSDLWELVITTSLNETNKVVNLVHVFPNPANNQVYCNWSNEKIRSMDIKIFDMNGSIILRNEKYQNDKPINVNTLPSGHYLVSVEDRSTNIFKQKMIMIQH